jgi:hypothetical protein
MVYVYSSTTTCYSYYTHTLANFLYEETTSIEHSIVIHQDENGRQSLQLASSHS